VDEKVAGASAGQTRRTGRSIPCSLTRAIRAAYSVSIDSSSRNSICDLQSRVFPEQKQTTNRITAAIGVCLHVDKPSFFTIRAFPVWDVVFLTQPYPHGLALINPESACLLAVDQLHVFINFNAKTCLTGHEKFQGYYQRLENRTYTGNLSQERGRQSALSVIKLTQSYLEPILIASRRAVCC